MSHRACTPPRTSCIHTDWTVCDDVRAKLRTSITRLLVEHGYPPDEPAAVTLVMQQMEAMAPPRYAERRRGELG